jgi:TatD DNase family protein
MQLVDTHCHIQSIENDSGEPGTRRLWKEDSNSVEEIISSAKENGVETMVCVGCDLKDSKLAIDFVKNKSNLYASIGIHPHEASEYLKNNQRNDFVSLLSSEKVVAIGECGLDYFYNHSDKKDQIKVIEQQIILALDNNLPLIFHVREAFEDFWPLFDSLNSREKPIRGVLHSFTDSTKNMIRAVENGLFIGVNGIATFTKDSKQIEMYRNIPLTNLVLETDSPFLTPVPFRGNINEPKNVSVIAEFLASIRGEELDELSKLTTLNAKSLFRLN